MKNKKAQGWFVLIWVVIIIGFLVSLGINGIGSSQGQHTGIITAVEYNSNIIWDANLVYFKTSDTSNQEDIYCVHDINLMNQLESYAKTKEQVTIHFKNDFLFWKWQCNGGVSIIDGVEK